MASGITGSVFQAAESGSDVCGTDVGVDVLVGAGVMGENCFGFAVAVGIEAYARAGNFSVGSVTGRLIGVDVAPWHRPPGQVCPVQAVIKTQTIKTRIE